mgnify:CR=1 FL=1
MNISSKEESVKESRRKKVISGEIVSASANGCVLVRVNRMVRHSQYGKFMSVSKTYKVHDPAGKGIVGRRVNIVECRPMSRCKRWALVL